jgi:hypothetical protein
VEPQYSASVPENQPAVHHPPVNHAMPPRHELDGQGGLPEDQPMAVVKVYSVRGLEYGLMTFMLWFVAIGLVTSSLSLVNGGTSVDALAFPVSLLVVSLPIFAYFFIRLKRAEVANPSLRFEASKRRFSQLTQILSFFTCVFNLVALVYLLIQQAGGESETSLGKIFLNVSVILVVAGGIFVYYWHDEHRSFKK